MELVVAVDSWIKHNHKQRGKFAKELIKQIRLPLLSKACLENLLTDYSSFSNCADSKTYINNAIDNKSIDTHDPSSIGYQARYCNQENFEIISNIGTSLYKLDNRKSSDASKRFLSFLELHSSIYKSVFINGVIYFMGSNFIFSYSTLTKKVIEKRILGKKHINQYACTSNFMGKINIVGGFHANCRRLTIYGPKFILHLKILLFSIERILSFHFTQIIF